MSLLQEANQITTTKLSRNRTRRDPSEEIIVLSAKSDKIVYLHAIPACLSADRREAISGNARPCWCGAVGLTDSTRQESWHSTRRVLVELESNRALLASERARVAN